MFDYQNRAIDEEKSGFDDEQDDNLLWGKVIDNKWVKDEPSPNWTMMNEEEISYLTKVYLPE